MKTPIPALILSAALLTLSCSGEDRTGEIPYAPTVRIDPVIIDSNRATLQGTVLSSPNSSLVACGFFVGNDSLKKELRCESPSVVFRCQADSLTAGCHFAVAYAKNGIGQTTSDTLWFTIK